MKGAYSPAQKLSEYRLVVDRVHAAALEYGTVGDVRSLTTNDMDDEDEVESDNCDMVSTASGQLAYHSDISMLEEYMGEVGEDGKLKFSCDDYRRLSKTQSMKNLTERAEVQPYCTWSRMESY